MKVFKKQTVPDKLALAYLSVSLLVSLPDYEPHTQHKKRMKIATLRFSARGATRRNAEVV